MNLLLAMAGSVFMVFLDQTVVGVALDRMRLSLDLTRIEEEWIVTAYVLSFGALVQVGGYLGDRLGQRRMFVVGVALFTAASAMVGLSPISTWVIAGRALQGVGAALMQPASLALVAAAFPKESRGRALSTYYNVGGVALVLGPLLGGVITEYVGWRWIFLLNVPIAVATVGMALAWCPPDAPGKPAPFDGRGSALLIGGLACLVVGLQEGGAWGWSSPSTIACLLLGVLLLAILVPVERHSASPVLDLDLLADRGFAADVLVVAVTRFALVATTVFLGVWLQAVAHLRPTPAGLVILPAIVVMIVATAIAGRRLDRHGPRAVNAGGLAWMAVGHLAAVPALLRETWWGVVPGLILIGWGAGMASAANTDGVTRAPAAARGQASGLLQTLRQVGGAVGVPFVGLAAHLWGLAGAFACLGLVLLVATPITWRAQS